MRALRLVWPLTLAGVVAGSGCFYPDYMFVSTEDAGQGGGEDGPTGEAGTLGDASSEQDARGAADAPGEEDCVNQIDDNDDGLVDCADPKCAAYACAEAPSAPWTGPFALYEGASSDPPPPCPSLYAKSPMFDASGQLDAPPAQCSPCTCGEPTGITCTLPKATLWDAANQCNTGCRWEVDIEQDKCIAYALTPGDCTGDTPSAIEFPPATLSATCAASDQVAAVSPYSWGTTARLCAPSAAGGGCGGSNACVPKPTGPYEPKLCIVTQGDSPCPPGRYRSKRMLYQGGVTDDRDCSSCSCETPTDIACSATMNFYLKAGCSAVAASFETGTTCGTFSAGFQQFLKYVPGPVPTGGTCAPSGGEPVGAAVPDAKHALTVCCEGS